MITCPAMIFISLSNILKGFFYGTSKITMPSLIDILEKALRIFILAILIFMFKAQTLENLVALAYVSLCLGELQSLLLLYCYFKVLTKKFSIKPKKREGRAQLLFDVLITSFPLCLNGFLMSIFGTLSALIVPRRLMLAGFTYSESLALIGKYLGMSLAIVTFPLIIVSSINTMLIPDLSQTMSKKDYYSVVKRIKEVLKIAFLIGIATTVICQCVPDALGKLFFGRSDLGNFIKTSSLIMPIVFTSNTMYGILNGLNKQNIILRNTIITEILEIACLFIFTAIPSINIYGYAITMFFVSSLSLCLNLYEVYKTIDIELSLAKILIYSLTGILCYICFNTLSIQLSTIDYRLQAIIVTSFTTLVFLCLILSSKVK
ncbi:MAG: stage V sporulation protein B, partial [Sarcina sp.]